MLVEPTPAPVQLPPITEAELAHLRADLDKQRTELERFAQIHRDAELARQLETGLPRLSSGKQDGVNKPNEWKPKEETWQQYSVRLAVYFVNIGIDRAKWGLRALSYLPPAAQHAFFAHAGISPAEMNETNCSYAVVEAFCQQHQVAHLQTNADLREKLFRHLKQYNSSTRSTMPLADHLAAVEALFAKCSAPLDSATKVYAVMSSLHPDLKQLCRIDPNTQQEFLTYEALRAHLVTMSGEAARLVAAADRASSSHNTHSGSRKRQYPGQHTGQQPHAAAPKKPKGYNTWSPEQKKLADEGRCVHCKNTWAPGHRCLDKVGVVEHIPTTTAAPTAPLACALISNNPVVVEEACHLAGDAADTCAVTHNMPASHTTHTSPSHSAATAAVTPDEEDLDELIEAYIAFDVLWENEKRMQAKFVSDAIARAHSQSLAAMQTRRKQQRTATANDMPHTNVATDTVDVTGEHKRVTRLEFQQVQNLLGVTFTLEAGSSTDDT